jgi:hypothetical protein
MTFGCLGLAAAFFAAGLDLEEEEEEEDEG